METVGVVCGPVVEGRNRTAEIPQVREPIRYRPLRGGFPRRSTGRPIRRGWRRTDRGDAVRETVRGVEGIRASVLTGGRDEFIVRMKEKFDELGPAQFLARTGMDVEAVPAFIVEPPTMYTFLDLVVMADGASLARVWDATPYPKHYLYVDGDKRDETAFEEGDHWEPREDTNRRFGQWVMEAQDAQAPVTPTSASLRAIPRRRHGLGTVPRPVSRRGRRDAGGPRPRGGVAVPAFPLGGGLTAWRRDPNRHGAPRTGP